MDWLIAAFLGLVQGATEFLPVSSSGHLVLMEWLLGSAQEGIRFEVAVHVATLVAVLVFYRRRVAELVRGLSQGSTDATRYAGKLVIATLPAVVVGLTAREFLEFLYELPQAVGLALLATGTLLYSTRHTVAAGRQQEPGWSAAFWIGCAQALAIVPGISRSGATVSVALALGVAPASAAEFSFLMSVIAVLGATVLQAPEFWAASASAWREIGLGAAVALVSGLASLWLFVRLLRGRSFHRFAYYAWGLGSVVLLWHYAFA
jgi:undecaprenyl-diphosphatase